MPSAQFGQNHSAVALKYLADHGLQTPNWNPELLGLGRQIGQINFGASRVFSAKLSAPILVHWVPCPYFSLFNHYFYKKTRLKVNPKLRAICQDHVCQEHVWYDHVCLDHACKNHVCQAHVCHNNVCQDHDFQDHFCHDHACQDHVCQDHVCQDHVCQENVCQKTFVKAMSRNFQIGFKI